MDWKQEAMEKLRQYCARQTAMQAIPDDIAALEAEGLSGMRMDGMHGKGGGAREDMLINNIVKREELKLAMDQANRWVSRVDRGLAALDEDERLVLQMLYILPAKGNIERLCEQLCMEQASIYRKRDKALRRFTLVMYGCMES